MRKGEAKNFKRTVGFVIVAIVTLPLLSLGAMLAIFHAVLNVPNRSVSDCQVSAYAFKRDMQDALGIEQEVTITSGTCADVTVTFQSGIEAQEFMNGNPPGKWVSVLVKTSDLRHLHDTRTKKPVRAISVHSLESISRL